MFVRNCWYVITRSEDLSEGLMARTVLNRPVVLYRRRDGLAVALEDRCCHRGLPLSMGRIEGDRVRCGYHGLLFEADGRCVEVPGQSAVPPGAAIETYPVVERYGWVWIWMGDRDRADAALVPDVAWHADPEWRTTDEYWHVEANYELLNDIQLDATHATYVHPSTLGSEAIQDTPPRVRRDGGRLEIHRWILDKPPPPIWAAARAFAGTVDRWILATFEPPSSCHFDIGAADAGTGAPEGDRSRGVSNRTAHMMTPETETTTHYFWAFGRNYNHDDDALSERIHASIRGTFEEDVEVVEAQQRSLSRTDFEQIDVGADAPTIQARRMVAAMREADRSSAP